MKRRVVGWVDITPERQWAAELACGHRYPIYDEGLSDKQRANVERDGDQVDCPSCSDLSSHVTRLEQELAAVRAELEKRGGLS
ncbi:MAG: hypothetical protein KF782_15415 [Labilithrix sp.]|nr:hypothetical protein [Labilithrix sp.]